MDIEDKISMLEIVLKKYEPHLKVWNTVHLEIIDDYLYIMFINPKSSNGFTSLIKEAPLADIDRIIKIYEDKLSKYES